MAMTTLNGAQLDPSSFGLYAPLVLRNGYSPIPIVPGGKRPLSSIGDWSRLRAKPLTEDEIGAIAIEHPHAGLGVVGGYRGLVPIDFDTDDQAILAAVRRVLPDVIVAKAGRRGSTAFYRDQSGLLPARKFRGRDGGMLLEVLGTGQTVIPPTLHPVTSRPYVWLTECTLFDTSIDELPELPA